MSLFKWLNPKNPPPDESGVVNFGTAEVPTIRLLANVVEGNGVKLTRRRRQADGTYLVDVAWTKGAEIEVSPSTGQKYVDRGLAVWVQP